MATGEKRYRDFSDFLNLHFDCKVQKISLHAGFTCPNRDGSIGVGGCTYCNNQTFSPDYCHTGKSITSQLEEGIAFFARKYPEMHYLAYFQAYTNTYGELAVLKQKYEEALFHPGVVGIIVGTRPDCMPDGLLEHSYWWSMAWRVLATKLCVGLTGDMILPLRSMLFVVRLKWVLQWGLT